MESDGALAGYWGAAPAREPLQSEFLLDDACALRSVDPSQTDGNFTRNDRPPRPTPEDTDAAPPARRALPLRHYLWGVGAALIVIFALRWLEAVLTPFLIGAILAYLGTPLVDAAQRRGMPRTLATTIAVLLFGLLLLAVFLVLIPLVQGEVSLAAKRLPALLAQASAQVAPWIQERFGLTVSLDLESLKTFVTENVESAHDLSLRLLSGVKTGSRIALSIAHQPCADSGRDVLPAA